MPTFNAPRGSALSVPVAIGPAACALSIRAGKLADLVILSRNPLSLDPERLLDLRIVETISHGLSVHRAHEL